MDRFSQLWNELRQSNSLPGGVLAEQCESELKEVVQQIDLIFNVKEREWRNEIKNLQAQLGRLERFNERQTATIASKDTQLVEMKQHIASMTSHSDSIVSKYENHITSLQSSVDKVKTEYDKLQKKYQKAMASVESTVGTNKPKDTETQNINLSVSKDSESFIVTELRKELHIKTDDITALKNTLDSVTTAHQDSLRTNERLLNDLRSVNATLKKSEIEREELKTALMTCEARLSLAVSDDQQYAVALQQLEKNITEKDKIIQMLTDVKSREENEQFAILKDQLTSSKKLCLELERREEDARRDVVASKLESEAMRQAHDKRCFELQLEIGSAKRLSEEERQRLLAEIAKLTDKYAVLESGLTAEGRAFREELSQVVEEAYRKGIVVADLKSKTHHLESALSDTRIQLQDKQHRLTEALSQLNYVRDDNRRLLYAVSNSNKEPKQPVNGYDIRNDDCDRSSISSGVIPEDELHLNLDSFVYSSPAQVPTHAAGDQAGVNDNHIPPDNEKLLNLTHLTDLSLGPDRPGSRQSVTQKFLEDEAQRANCLQQKLDQRINDLEMNTLKIVQRYTVT